MKILSLLLAGLSLVTLMGGDAATPSAKSISLPHVPSPADPPGFEVPGRTQCIPARKCMIAPTVLHRVVEVLVAAGDCVKKGQPLVRLDRDEAQADVRAKQATWESARVALAEARRQLGAAEKARAALPEQKYQEIWVAATRAGMDEQAAKAALESAKAELEHYLVTALIDGVVNRLEVYPGMVSRPGTSVWGEILDLAEIDVRCELTLAQVDLVALGQAAEVRALNSTKGYETGRVVFVGLEVDKESERVPVVVRLNNAQARLRGHMPVVVQFPASNHAPSGSECRPAQQMK
jgi:RND family efflux transporter MFP subunit